MQGDPTIQNSFVVSSDGAPGDILAKLVSKSDDGIRELELMGKDEMDTDNGGNHPWSLENGADATLLLFNPTNSAQYFNVILSGGGVTWYKAYHLQPMQTESIGIRELIQDRVKDDKGNTLPADAQEGQVDWYVPATNAGRGRVLETNKATLMARSFSCGGQVEICEAFINGLNSIPVGNDEYGNISTDVCMNQCSGTVLGSGGSGYTYDWWTSGVPTISGSKTNSSAEVYGPTVGDGSTDGSVSDGYCEITPPPVPTPVIQVKINSVSLTSDQISVPINGPGGTEAMLQIAWNGPNGNADIANVDKGSGTYIFNPSLTNLVTGQYYGIFASWNGVQDAYNTSFYALGNWRHSQYNTPNEGGCVQSPASAYLVNSSTCAYQSGSLKSDFISQSWLNGSGITTGAYYGYDTEQNAAYCITNGHLPSDASGKSFAFVTQFTGGCGSGYPVDNSTVAYNTSDANLGCGDQVLIVGLGGGTGTVKTVTDKCPRCSNSQLDNYTTQTACQIGSFSDLGNFETIRVNR